MNVKSARLYVSPSRRPLTPEENETRRISYAIKDPASLTYAQDLETAAREMARLFFCPCILVPVPDRNGNTGANWKLAAAIARHIAPNAKVIDILKRAKPVESSCERHRRRAGALPVEQHHIIRNPKKWLSLKAGTRLFFVDNTTTSGNTLAACRAAIGAGEGLTFSDAYRG